MVQTVYSNQLEVVLSRLEGMTYEEAQKYYNHASKNYGLSDSEIIVLTAAVEKLKQAQPREGQGLAPQLFFMLSDAFGQTALQMV